jgi:hypothetical protein
MIHRLALIIGSVAAAGILALGFAATGFGPNAAPANADQSTTASVADAAGPATDLPAAKPVTRVQTTTVYVKPAPKPKVIHVTRSASAPGGNQAPAKRQVKVVHVTKPIRGDDGGGEGGDD